MLNHEEKESCFSQFLNSPDSTLFISRRIEGEDDANGKVDDDDDDDQPTQRNQRRENFFFFLFVLLSLKN